MSELLKINVNDHTEKKANLTYLSWAWAWAEVLKHDPSATWESVEYLAPDHSTQPAMYLPDGSAMVHCKVTINGITRSCKLPVMDHRNKAIKEPDAFAVNTAIMRCMTKAVSMHGLGLYIYAGEDLPEEDKVTKSTAKVTAEQTPVDQEVMDQVASVGDEMMSAWEAGDQLTVLKLWRSITDNDTKIHLWAWLSSESKLRSFLKANKEISQ
jgi:hypothetical protein